jgi:hypothetical protein
MGSPETRTSALDLVLPFTVAAIGALGALPGSRSGPDPVALLVWLALWSAPAGFLCGAGKVAKAPLALLAPGLWMGLVALVDGLSPRDLPSPAWAALAWTGLYAAGFGCGRLAPGRGLAGAGALFLLAGFLSALPIAAGSLGGALPPEVSARLLDLAPTTLLAECAGLDWLRHPAIYDAAGTADIDPALRHAFRGPLAGPLAFVVGCALAALGAGIARARSKASERERWPSTSTSAPSPRT